MPRPFLRSRARRRTSRSCEVGLGGRLDSTNVVPHPIATIITALGIDHTEFLGAHDRPYRLREGRDLKPGALAIVARQEPVEAEMSSRRSGQARRLGHGLPAKSSMRMRSKGASSIRTRMDCWICRCRALWAAIRSPMRRSPSRPCGSLKIRRVGESGDRRWLAKCLMAGAHAALDGGPAGRPRARGRRRLARRRSQCDERRGACPCDLRDRRKSARPLYLIIGMLKTKDAEGCSGAFKGLARHVFTVPVGQLGGEPFGRRALRHRNRGRIRCEAGTRYRGSDEFARARRRRSSSMPAKHRASSFAARSIVAGEVLRENS